MKRDLEKCWFRKKNLKKIKQKNYDSYLHICLRNVVVAGGVGNVLPELPNTAGIHIPLFYFYESTFFGAIFPWEAVYFLKAK